MEDDGSTETQGFRTMFHDSALASRPQQSATLKEAMRRFVGAVSVVTSGTGETRTGATVTTAHSLSIDPETMLVSINRASSTWTAIAETGAFCVNLLPADRTDVADRFAGRGGLKGAARYEGSDWSRLSTGAAVLADALAAVDCRVERVVEHHSHALVFGRVEAVLLGGERPALLYGHGRYGACPSLRSPTEIV